MSSDADLNSPEHLKEITLRLRDSKDGVKLKRKVTDPKKKKKQGCATGNSVVEWLLRDIGERRIISKQDVTSIAQSLLDRQVMVKLEGSPEGVKFSEADSYYFNEEGIEALELEILLKNSEHKTLSSIASFMNSERGIEKKEKKHRLRKYKNAFSGQECFTWLSNNLSLEKKDFAITIAQQLQNKGFIVNILSKNEPVNDKALYQMAADGDFSETDHEPTPNLDIPTQATSPRTNESPRTTSSPRVSPPIAIEATRSTSKESLGNSPLSSPKETKWVEQSSSRQATNRAPLLGNQKRSNSTAQLRAENARASPTPVGSLPGRKDSDVGAYASTSAIQRRNLKSSLGVSEQNSPVRSASSPNQFSDGSPQGFDSATRDNSGSVKNQFLDLEREYHSTVANMLQNLLRANPSWDKRERESLVSTLPEIVAIHQNVLEMASSDSVSLSEILTKLQSCLELYSVFIINQNNAQTTASSLRAQHRLSDPDGVWENLLEYPKQHFDGYPGFIFSLLEQIDPSLDPEYNSLSELQQSFARALQQTRDRDLIPKALVPLWDVEHSFPRDVKLHLGERELFATGSGEIIADSSAKEDPVVYPTVHVFMFSNLVLCATPINGYLLRPLINSTFDDLWVRDVPDCESPNAIEFVTKVRKLMVKLASNSVKRAWMNHLPVRYPEERKMLDTLVSL